MRIWQEEVSTDKCVPLPDLDSKQQQTLHTVEVDVMSIIHAKHSLYISVPLYFSFDENFKLWFDGGWGVTPNPNRVGQIELQTWCGPLTQLHLICVILVILGGSCFV